MDLNPYAASLLPVEPAELFLAENAGPATCWRDGSFVVTRAGASLPARCVKSNASADTAKRLRHTCLPLSAIVTIVSGPLLPSAWRTQPEFIDLSLPLSSAWRRRSQLRMLLGCVLFLVGVVFSVFLGVQAPDDAGAMGRAAGMLTVSCAALSFAIVQGVGVRVHHVRHGHIWLAGAGEPFLNSLPLWPPLVSKT